MYDRAIFWLGASAVFAAIGGILMATKGWFDIGVGAILIAVGLLDWALVLYLAHRHIEGHLAAQAKPLTVGPSEAVQLQLKPLPDPITMIARPPGTRLHPQSDIDIKLLHHQWLMVSGKQVLSVGVRIHNRSSQLARAIKRHHWLFGSDGRAVIGTELVVTVKAHSSRTVGTIEPLETIEGTISCEFSSPQHQPTFDLYIGDDLGLEAIADR
jgi:hypothetical protein